MKTKVITKEIKAFAKITNVDFGVMCGFEEPTLRLILQVDRTFYVLDELGNDLKSTYLFFKGDKLTNFIKEFKIESINNLKERTCLLQFSKVYPQGKFRTDIPFKTTILHITDDIFVEESKK